MDSLNNILLASKKQLDYLDNELKQIHPKQGR